MVVLGHKKARLNRRACTLSYSLVPPAASLLHDDLADRLRAMNARLLVAVTRQDQCQPVCAHGDHDAVVFVCAENIRISGPVSRSAIGGDGDGGEKLCKFFPSYKLGDAEKVGDIVGDSDGDVHFLDGSRVEGQAGLLNSAHTPLKEQAPFQFPHYVVLPILKRDFPLAFASHSV